MFNVENFVISGQSFTSTTGLESISQSVETDFMLLKNPSTNENPIILTHTVFAVDSTAVRSFLRVYSNPTITDDGVSLNIFSTKISQTPIVSSLESFKNPTISNRGNYLSTVMIQANSSYYIEPNNSILLTIENNATNVNSFIECYWIEEV